jgi:GAF domain-containing protein
VSDKRACSSQNALTSGGASCNDGRVDAGIRDNERRHAALDAFGPDPFAATAFEDLTRVAADLVGTPMAALSVLTRAGGRFKAAIGIAGGKRSSDAFATWALSQPTRVLVVEDAAKDPEMQKALSEAGLESIRFYAAVALTLSSGEAIGALCVMGDAPRKVSHGVLEKLKFLGDQVIRTLEDRQRSARPRAG